MRYVDPIHKIAYRLVVGGLSLLAISVAWQFVIRFDWMPIAFELGPRDSSLLGIVLILGGVLLAIWRQIALDSTITGVLIIHRAMAGMDTSDPSSVLPRSMKIGHLKTISIREQNFHQDGRLINPDAALRTVNTLDTQISSSVPQDSSPSIAYAGLAPIPLLVAAGYRISSRQPSLILDYDRASGWHLLEEEDDGEEITIVAPSKVDQGVNKCTIVLPLSVEIGVDQIPDYLRAGAYWARLQNGARADSLNSEQKQLRMAKDVYNFLAGLRSKLPSVEVVHVFLACQASWAVRFGTIISMSVHPSIAIYQFEKNQYRWGVKIQAGREPEICSL